MFPNGLALQILCQMRDLCTINGDRRVEPDDVCYKTHSDAKLLIFNGLHGCTFSGHLSQALDFSGFGGRQRRTINKVIHTIRSLRAKLIQINDLKGVSEIHLKTGA
jgi:hypothetical protein